MLDPWESLKINERRGLLGAVNGQNGGGGAEIDIYDISGDCRYPQLLASQALVAPDARPIIGHEGSWAPDGLTYYGADLRYLPAGAVATGQYYAVDTTDTFDVGVQSLASHHVYLENLGGDMSSPDSFLREAAAATGARFGVTYAAAFEIVG